MLDARYRLNRRGLLQVGALGVIGSTVPWMYSNRTAIANENKLAGSAKVGSAELGLGGGKAKSVLLVLLSGGPSQLDMWDPKPDAPAEVRGEFSTIATTMPGVAVCEHMPRLAKQTQLWTILRTMSHREHNHLLATHVALTGRPTPIPRGGSDLDRVESRNDFPNFAAALDYIRPRQDGIPTGVSLPNYLIEGPLTWPGQHAGFLGAKHDPWQIQGDPSSGNFKVDALSLRDGMTQQRLASRQELLKHFNAKTNSPSTAELTAFRDQQEIAYRLLTSGKMTEAFDISRESEATRERYGKNKFGQSLLLSRRMIEAGVPMVQATMGIVQTWDTHVDNWGRLKNTLLPQLDQGLEALMLDLSTTGLLDQTLVIVMGEFGRTPKISTLPGQKIAGRDHWAHAYSGLFAGAGVRGGQVIGQTDYQAAYPLSRPWTPADVCSTIFHAMGVPEDVQLTDPLERPHHLLNGTIIAPLYTGREA